MVLKPVASVDWNEKKMELYRPTGEEQSVQHEKTVRVYGINSEIRCQDLENKFKDIGYINATAEIKGINQNWAMVDLCNKRNVDEVVSKYGRDAKESLYIGNIRLNLEIPPPPGTIMCFLCRQIGHMKFNCPQAQNDGNGPNVGRTPIVSTIVAKQPGDTLALTRTELNNHIQKKMTSLMNTEIKTLLAGQVGQYVARAESRLVAIESKTNDALERQNKIIERVQDDMDRTAKNTDARLAAMNSGIQDIMMFLKQSKGSTQGEQENEQQESQPRTDQIHDVLMDDADGTEVDSDF